MSKRKENSSNSINRDYIIECDLTYAMDLVGGRWKLLILCRLENGPLRFSELRRSLHGITERMLTLQLKELEADNMLRRTVYAEVPPRVEYELTHVAKELIPVWKQLGDWGMRHRHCRMSAVKAS